MVDEHPGAAVGVQVEKAVSCYWMLLGWVGMLA